MRVRRAPVLSACLALIGLAVGIPSAAADRGPDTYTFAVIGDIPYGAAQIAAVPEGRSTRSTRTGRSSWSPSRGHQERLVASAATSTSRMIKTQFDRFADPLVYTIGRQRVDRLPPREQRRVQPAGAAGEGPPGVLPAARPDARSALGEGRQPGRAGHPGERPVRPGRRSHSPRCTSSAATTAWRPGPARPPDAGAVRRGARPYGGRHRRASATRSPQARDEHDRAVVLLTQADMFDPTVATPPFADYYAFQPIVQAIAARGVELPRPGVPVQRRQPRLQQRQAAVGEFVMGRRSTA